MVGYELLGEAQRDVTAEQAAAQLRSESEVHCSLAARSTEPLSYVQKRYRSSRPRLPVLGELQARALS
jgi:hypothetical protein